MNPSRTRLRRAPCSASRHIRRWRRESRARAGSGTGRGLARRLPSASIRRVPAVQRVLVVVEGRATPVGRGEVAAGSGGRPGPPGLTSKKERPVSVGAPREPARAEPALTVRRRRSANSSNTRSAVRAALDVELGERDAPPLDRPVGALAGEADEEAAREHLLRPRVELCVRVLGQPCDGALDAAGSRGRRVWPRRRPCRRCQMSSRAADRSGRAPGELDVVKERGVPARARPRGLRDCAGQLHCTTQLVATASARPARGSPRVGPARAGLGRAVARSGPLGSPARRSPRSCWSRATRTSSDTKAARSSSSRHAVKVSSDWSTTSTTFGSPSMPGQPPHSARERRCTPGRMSTRAHCSLQAGPRRRGRA